MYYTPHIDELYIGLECEYKVSDGDWVPFVIEELDCDEDVQFYRIKQLDADDVIAEGFELFMENKRYKGFRKVLYSESIPYMVEVRLYKKDGDPIVEILKENTTVIKAVFLKNKSEFQWLVARLV